MLWFKDPERLSNKKSSKVDGGISPGRRNRIDSQGMPTEVYGCDNGMSREKEGWRGGYKWSAGDGGREAVETKEIGLFQSWRWEGDIGCGGEVGKGTICSQLTSFTDWRGLRVSRKFQLELGAARQLLMYCELYMVWEGVKERLLIFQSINSEAKILFFKYSLSNFHDILS